MSDFSIYKALEAARLGASTELSASGPANVVAQSHTNTGITYSIANLAAANVAEQVIMQAKYRANIISVNIAPSAAFVANATDYNVVTIFKRTGNAAAVTVGTANFSGAAGVAFVPTTITLVSNSANTQLAAGDVVTITSTKTGNGAANNPQATINLVLEDT